MHTTAAQLRTIISPWEAVAGSELLRRTPLFAILLAGTQSSKDVQHSPQLNSADASEATKQQHQWQQSLGGQDHQQHHQELQQQRQGQTGHRQADVGQKESPGWWEHPAAASEQRVDQVKLRVLGTVLVLNLGGR